MTGTYRIPETIHQINTTSNRESYMFKKKAGLLTRNIFISFPCLAQWIFDKDFSYLQLRDSP